MAIIWEYLVLGKPKGEWTVDFLNQCGAEGWELVEFNFVSKQAIFKRIKNAGPKQNESTDPRIKYTQC